jgi:hypothetical protein
VRPRTQGNDSGTFDSDTQSAFFVIARRKWKLMPRKSSL